jgi:SAM-dependent methyltransferase
MSDMELPRDHHHYIVLSLIHHWIRNVALPQANGVMLDYGCGGQPYRSLFETRISEYIGADVEAAFGIELDLEITPGTPLALDCQSVDTILSTQTLEHVYDFRSYLAECRRLLRPGGQLVLTVPMQWRMHETPFDYWRFTKYGVLSALGEQGFEVIELSPCGGAWALLGQLLNSHLAECQRGSRLLFWLVNRIALWADKRYPDAEETIGWMCVARMPIFSE